ncbi:MAG: nucleotide excision repair endonuclease [Pirellulaceae bacterium]
MSPSDADDFDHDFLGEEGLDAALSDSEPDELETDDGWETDEAAAEVDIGLAELAEAADAAETPAATQGPSPTHEFGFRRAAARVREFPATPGVYLFKDAAGRVIYVGKAKRLRSRAGSYFTRAAELEARTAAWVHEICDADYLECESEVDAMLAEPD